MVALKVFLGCTDYNVFFSKRTFTDLFDLTSVFLFTQANKIRSTKNTAIAALFL